MLSRSLAMLMALSFVAASLPRLAAAAEPTVIQRDATVVKDASAQDEQKKWFKIKKGETVQVVYERDTWYWIKTAKGQQAWILKKIFKLKDEAAKPAAAAPEATAVPELEPLGATAIAAAATPQASAEPAPSAADLKTLTKPATTSTPVATPAAEAKPEPALASAAPATGGEPRDVQLRLRRLADDLAAAARKLPTDPRYLRFAVLPFEALDPKSKEQGLGLVIADEIASTFVRDHRLPLVERAHLKAVLDEMALQQSGITDDARAVKLGEIANADMLVVGQVSLLGDAYQINARLLEVATAHVAGTASATLPAADLVALSSDAVVLRSKGDAAFRSLVLPGWGQHYNHEATKGWVFTGVAGTLLVLGLGLETGGLLTHMLYYQPYAPADDGFANAGDPKFQRNLQDRYNLATTQFVAGHITLGVTAAVWAYNVLDAYLSGVDGDEMLGGAAGD